MTNDAVILLSFSVRPLLSFIPYTGIGWCSMISTFILSIIIIFLFGLFLIVQIVHRATNT